MPEPKKHFTQAFRDEAVRLAQTSGRSGREIAEDLGIGLSTLRNWITARHGRAMDEVPADRQEDVAAALKRLRRENEVLRQEREILKRATTAFAPPLLSPRREVGEGPAHRCGEEEVPRPAPVQGPRREPERLLCLEEPSCLPASA
jgi:transposase